MLQGGALVLSSILDGTGSLTNFNQAMLGGIINVAVDNELGVLDSTGQINNDADRPFVNGPNATLGHWGTGFFQPESRLG